MGSLLSIHLLVAFVESQHKTMRPDVVKNNLKWAPVTFAVKAVVSREGSSVKLRPFTNSYLDEPHVTPNRILKLLKIHFPSGWHLKYN